MLPREKEKIAYSNKLKSKFMFSKEVRRILRHRHLPRLIEKKKRVKQIQLESKHRKEGKRPPSAGIPCSLRIIV